MRVETPRKRRGKCGEVMVFSTKSPLRNLRGGRVRAGHAALLAREPMFNGDLHGLPQLGGEPAGPYDLAAIGEADLDCCRLVKDELRDRRAIRLAPEHALHLRGVCAETSLGDRVPI